MIAAVMTDYGEPYEQGVPSEKHSQSKAETYTVEGYNSLFRHFLARFRRKTKCYSKSETMLRYSVMLLMAHWNGETMLRYSVMLLMAHWNGELGYILN
jgi:insertion element IS1 protein InsB